MNRKLGFICKSAFYSAMRNLRSYKPCGLCVQNSGTAFRLLHHTPVYICSIWAHISVSHIFLLTFLTAYSTPTVPSCIILLTFLRLFSEYFTSDLWRRNVMECWYVTKDLQIAIRTSYTIHVTHALHERDYVNRVNFCQNFFFLQLINQNQELVNNLLMSDEAHFHLSVYNKFFHYQRFN